MKRTMLKAKIQKLKVTETNLEYEGSLTLDEDLMKTADVKPFEQVHVYNISNGDRFSTYLIKGAKNSGVVGVNGAAVHKAKKGDKLIVASFVLLEEEEIDFHMPKVLIVGEDNKVKKIK